MKKTILRILLLIIVFVTFVTGRQKAQADTKYITTKDFCIEIAKQLDLKSENKNDTEGYVNALITNGVLCKEDIPSLEKNLTRADALVMINKVDEYLYGITTEEKAVQKVINCRISDITNISKDKREDVAKAFLKGFMKGYSNGTYSQDRELRGTKKITREGALNVISMLKDKSKRAVMSPDGQLTRTTNLPNNAEMFPYILTSFPNDYYERRFNFEGVTQRINGKVVPMKSPEDYAEPIDMNKVSFIGIDNFSEARSLYTDLWVKKAEIYLNTILSFNYKTVDQDWIDTMVSTDSDYKTAMEGRLRDEIDLYIKDAKENKTIIECNKVVVEPSSMYFYNGAFYLRCYVKYRIVSSKAPSLCTTDELFENLPYKGVFWSLSRNFSYIPGYKLGEWREEIYDVNFGKTNTSGEGLGFGVIGVLFDYEVNRRIERN